MVLSFPKWGCIYMQFWQERFPFDRKIVQYFLPGSPYLRWFLSGEWWDYKNTRIFEGFLCKNFSVASYSTSKYHIFHIFKSCYYLFWFIKNRFQNHLKSTLFSKNRSQQKVEFLLCCMLSQLTSAFLHSNLGWLHESVFTDFFFKHHQ